MRNSYRKWIGVAVIGAAVLTSCRGTPPATFESTRRAELPFGQSALPSPVAGERFDNYDDTKADNFLTRRVNEKLEHQMLERDERRRQDELEMRQLQEQRRPVVVERSAGTQYGNRRRDAQWRMPWNTLFYGALGAAIGEHNDKRSEGIAIGAGVGLLMDLMRWHR